MKKVMMLVAVLLGTTAMVNAQVAPVKSASAKEVKTSKHTKLLAQKKAEKMEVAPAKSAIVTPAAKTKAKN